MLLQIKLHVMLLLFEAVMFYVFWLTASKDIREKDENARKKNTLRREEQQISSPFLGEGNNRFLPHFEVGGTTDFFRILR